MDIEKLIEDAAREEDLDALEALEDLFRQSETSVAPYSAAIEFSPSAVQRLEQDGDAEMVAPGTTEVDIASPQGLRSGAIALANKLARAKRKVQYRIKIARGFDGLRIVTEGDSWYQYPIFLKDVVDHLSDDDDKAIYSLGAAADTIVNIAEHGEYLEAIKEVDPHLMLISGGGNDLMDDGQLQAILKPYFEGADPTDLVNEVELAAFIDRVEKAYRTIINSVAQEHSSLPIFGHSYDLPYPEDNGFYLGGPLQDKGIPLDIGRRVVEVMLDRFADLLKNLDQEYSSFYFVTTKGTVGSSANSWENEFHPKSAGFGRVAVAFRERIDAVVSLATPSSTRLADAINVVPAESEGQEPLPVSAATYSDRQPSLRFRPAAFEKAAPQSSFGERYLMGEVILSYEARRDSNGNLAVYKLPGADGGGAYEVAGINERYHKTHADHLVGLIESGRFGEAEDYAIEFMCGYTDSADRWCHSNAVEFFLRDSMFNRGPGGAAWIVQHAVEVATDRVVGPITRKAIANAERDPAAFLQELRSSREVYERLRRDESSIFWVGLTNRWNKALSHSQTLLAATPMAVSAVVPRLPSIPAAPRSTIQVFRTGSPISRGELDGTLVDLMETKRELKKRFGMISGATMASTLSSGITSDPQHNILGIGVGEKISEGQPTGQMAVKLYMRRKFKKEQISTAHMIETELDGIVLDVEEVGEIAPLALPDPKRAYDTPVPGCSVGYDDTMAGTFGALVRDRNGRQYMLSNNHVLAAEDQLPPGAPIFQQGKVDAIGGEARQVGRLAATVPLGMHSLDVALAEPDAGFKFSNETLHIGSPVGVSDVYQNQEVHKFGRTTSYTAGVVAAMAVDVQVPYRDGVMRLFEDQIAVRSMTSARFSDSGDSGSLVMSRNGNLGVGLLFAGSASTTFLHPIKDVLSALDLELVL